MAGAAGDPDLRRSQLPDLRLVRARAAGATPLRRDPARPRRTLDPAQRRGRRLPAASLGRRSVRHRDPARRAAGVPGDRRGHGSRVRADGLPLPPDPPALRRGDRRRAGDRERGAPARRVLGVADRRGRPPGARDRAPRARPSRGPHQRAGDPRLLAEPRLGARRAARAHRRRTRRAAHARAARADGPGLARDDHGRVQLPAANRPVPPLPAAARRSARAPTHAARDRGAPTALVRRLPRRARPPLSLRRPATAGLRRHRRSSRATNARGAAAAARAGRDRGWRAIRRRARLRVDAGERGGHAAGPRGIPPRGGAALRLRAARVHGRAAARGDGRRGDRG